MRGCRSRPNGQDLRKQTLRVWFTKSVGFWEILWRRSTRVRISSPANPFLSCQERKVFYPKRKNGGPVGPLGRWYHFFYSFSFYVRLVVRRALARHGRGQDGPWGEMKGGSLSPKTGGGAVAPLRFGAIENLVPHSSLSRMFTKSAFEGMPVQVDKKGGPFWIP